MVVRQLIPPPVIKQLREFYFKHEKIHYGDKLGIHYTAHTNNYDILREIHETLVNLTTEYADKYLTGHKFYLDNFLAKESRQDSLFDLHQDWTCVDHKFENLPGIWNTNLIEEVLCTTLFGDKLRFQVSIAVII